MMVSSVYEETSQKMKQAVEAVKKEFATVRTGRATTAMFDGVTVDYYGTQTPINQLAKLQIPEAKQVLITPYDPGSLEAIEKALMESDLGFNPNNDGEVIRIQIPDLTEERRKELSSVVKEYAEEGKIAIRNIRREARDEIDLLESEGEISEDDAHRAKDKIQELTDQSEAAIENALEKKIDEIMKV